MLRLTSCIPPGVPGNHWDGFHRDVLRRFQTVSDESPADAGLGAEAFQGCVCCTGVSRFHTRACLTESTQHSAPRETSRSPDGRLTCRRAGGKELGGEMLGSSPLTCPAVSASVSQGARQGTLQRGRESPFPRLAVSLPPRKGCGLPIPAQASDSHPRRCLWARLLFRASDY